MRSKRPWICRRISAENMALRSVYLGYPKQIDCFWFRISIGLGITRSTRLTNDPAPKLLRIAVNLPTRSEIQGIKLSEDGSRIAWVISEKDQSNLNPIVRRMLEWLRGKSDGTSLKLMVNKSDGSEMHEVGRL